MDTHKRSVAKSVIWRVIGVILLAIIAYLVTKSGGKMAVITVLFHLIGLAIYYLHERIWQKIPWGKREHPLASIELREEVREEDLEIVKQRLRELGYIADTEQPSNNGETTDSDRRATETGIREDRKRSLMKALSFRLGGVCVLGVISFIVTRSIKEMTEIIMIFHTIRVILYYFHERVWERIAWGRIKHPLSAISVNGSVTKEDLEIIKEQLKDLGYTID